MSIICDGGLTNNIIEEFGETIYLRVGSSQTFADEYGKETVHWIQYKIKGLMNVYSADTDGVKEGRYYSGEITFMIDTDYEDLATVNNKIYYPPDDVWYEIERLRKYRISGTTYVLEISVFKKGKTLGDNVQVTINSWAVII